MNDDMYFEAMIETIQEVLERHGIRGLPDDPSLSIAEERALIKEVKRALRPPTRKEVQNLVIVEKLGAASKGKIFKTAGKLSELWDTLGPEYELDAGAILQRYYRHKKQGKL